MMKLIKKYPCEDWFYIRLLWILQEAKTKKNKNQAIRSEFYINFKKYQRKSIVSQLFKFISINKSLTKQKFLLIKKSL